MSFARGERVYIDLDSDLDQQEAPQDERSPAAPSSAFTGEILERNASTTNPPSAPTFRTNTTGFPTHKKRAAKTSTFKQQRASINKASTPTSAQANAPLRTAQNGVDDNERRKIGEENEQRIADMSAEEIERERQELLSSLSPALIQRLLGRSNIDDGSNEWDWKSEQPGAPLTDQMKAERKPPNNKKVTFEAPEAAVSEPPLISDQTSSPAAAPSTQAASSEPSEAAAIPQLDHLPSSIHFPKPPPSAELDPNSTTFLTDLHEKYFPDLPYDPSSVSWMKPIDTTDTTSPYHPSQTALEPAELRFNFKGALLAPSAAREIPVTEGLHHHSEAPEAAGYTIPELAILARSAVAAQRCVAFQVLGRILYRLGRGEFGIEEGKTRVEGPVDVVRDPNVVDEDEVWEEESVGSAMAAGLWQCVEEGRIIETLTQEAEREKGHLTARTYAQEALWNWRRGGGRKRRAV